MVSNGNGEYAFDHVGRLAHPTLNYGVGSSIHANEEIMNPVASACWDSLVSMDGRVGLGVRMLPNQAAAVHLLNSGLVCGDVDSGSFGIGDFNQFVQYHSTTPASFSALVNGRIHGSGIGEYPVVESTPVSAMVPLKFPLCDTSPCVDSCAIAARGGTWPSGAECDNSQHSTDQLRCHDAEQNLSTSPKDELEGRKRKRTLPESEIAPKPDAKDVSCASDDEKVKKEENSGDTPSKGSSKDNKNPDAFPKEDYIHVRARRGQATNSHSLAERVRREKISERMRFLQDLVPGCSKVTGKAVMLDEIINYVQSLQRQVEFLSMKLATVNPHMELDTEDMLSKDLYSSGGHGAAVLGFTKNLNSAGAYHTNIGPADIPVPSEGNVVQNSKNLVDTLRRSIAHHHLLDSDQVTGPWNDELTSVVQMRLASQMHLEASDPNDKNDH